MSTLVGVSQIAINTTGTAQNIQVLDVNSGSGEVAGLKTESIAASTLIVSFGGSLNIGFFKIAGGAQLTIGSTQITVNFSATLDLLGFGKLAVNGAAEIGVATPTSLPISV